MSTFAHNFMRWDKKPYCIYMLLLLLQLSLYIHIYDDLMFFVQTSKCIVCLINCSALRCDLAHTFALYQYVCVVHFPPNEKNKAVVASAAAKITRQNQLVHIERIALLSVWGSSHAHGADASRHLPWWANTATHTTPQHIIIIIALVCVRISISQHFSFGRARARL